MPVVLLEELELEQLQQQVLELESFLSQEQQLGLLFRMHLWSIRLSSSRCHSSLCRSNHCSSRRRFHNHKP